MRLLTLENHYLNEVIREEQMKTSKQKKRISHEILLLATAVSSTDAYLFYSKV